ncbi:MAG: LapA family protein [Nitrospinota bacterium]
MGSLRLLLGLAAALAVASFGVVNMEPVTIAYYKGQLRLPLFYTVLAAFAAGFLLAWLGGLFDRIRFRHGARTLRREIRDMEAEMARVREQSGRLLAAANPSPAEAPAPVLPPPSGGPQEEGPGGPRG